MVRRKYFTPKDAATGPTFTGVFSVLGVLIVLCTMSKFKYTKLLPHGVTTITYAVCMLATTFAKTNVSFSKQVVQHLAKRLMEGAKLAEIGCQYLRPSQFIKIKFLNRNNSVI